MCAWIFRRGRWLLPSFQHSISMLDLRINRQMWNLLIWVHHDKKKNMYPVSAILHSIQLADSLYWMCDWILREGKSMLPSRHKMRDLRPQKWKLQQMHFWISTVQQWVHLPNFWRRQVVQKICELVLHCMCIGQLSIQLQMQRSGCELFKVWLPEQEVFWVQKRPESKGHQLREWKLRLL